MSEPEALSLSRGKTMVFRLVAILISVLGLALIEVGFRLFSADAPASDPYVNISPFSIFSRGRLHGQDYYRITHRYGYANRKTTFPVQKPANGIRVIALGGSACASWPHPAEETFDRYLEQALRAAYPDQIVEVINAAAHGFASYRVRRIFDEILPLAPDAVIIYSGNNEFLERREYSLSGRSLAEALSRNLHVVRWLRGRFARPKTELPGEELKDVAMFFWKKAKQEALELREDPAKFAKVKAHYAASIEYMLEEAGKRGIPVLLFTVPVNLRDWLPTVSHSSPEAERRQEWQRWYHLGQRGLLQNEVAEGIQSMRRAIELEPEHAESHFWLGRLLELDGQTDPALASYKRARDLDYNPFRAHGEFNSTLRQIADLHDHVLLVDLASEFERLSERGIPGFDLFLDYVHPNKRGNLAIAKAAFHTLVQDGVLPAAPRTLEFRRRDLPYGPEGKVYDEEADLKLQHRMFRIYALNHQHQAAIDKVEDLVWLATGQRVEGDPANLPLSLRRQLREGYRTLQHYEAVRRRDILGLSVDPTEREAVKREMEAFYDKWYDYGSF